MEEEPVLVDVGAAKTLSDDDVREWAHDQCIFISSVITGMEAERAAVAETIEKLGAVAGVVRTLRRTRR